MSDNSSAVIQDGGVPGQASGSQGDQQGSITRADFDTLVSVVKAIKTQQDVLETSQKTIAQSISDKAAHKFETVLKRYTDKANEAGIPMTPELLEKVKEQVAFDMLRGEPFQSTAAPQQTQEGPKGGNQPDPVEAKMLSIQDQYKYVLTRFDPEFSKVAWDEQDENKFLASYEAAQKEAATRRGFKSEPPQTTDLSSSATARGGTLIGSGVLGENPIKDINDPKELIKMGLEALDKKK